MLFFQQTRPRISSASVATNPPIENEKKSRRFWLVPRFANKTTDATALGMLLIPVKPDMINRIIAKGFINAFRPSVWPTNLSPTVVY